MDILLKDTGLINQNMNDVIIFLNENNIKTVSNLINFNIDSLDTTNLNLKNQLRGLKDLLLFRYKGELIPTEYYLSQNIKIDEDIDRNIIVNVNEIDFQRMGFSNDEEKQLIDWSKILYSQYAKSDITVIDLFETFLNYNNKSSISLKLKTYLDYYYNYNYQLAINVNSIEDLKNLYSKMIFLRKRKKELDELLKQKRYISKGDILK